MTETINTKLDTILSAVKSNTDNMSVILEKYALQAVTLNSVLSRLDALEKMTSNSITPKRAIKTTLESKPEEEEDVSTPSIAKKAAKGKKVQTPEVTTTDSSSTASTSKDGTEITQVKRIANSVAFFKTIIFQTNYKGLRDTYTSQIEQLITDGKVDKKFDKNKDANKYWLNLGSLVWKNYITSKADKDNMSKLFKEWQASVKTQGVTSNQLEEDEQDE